MAISAVEQTPIEGYGIIPDIEIKSTIEELVNKEDPELNWILNDIQQNTAK